MTARSPYDTLVTVYGGSGFLGRHLVRALAKRHYRIRVAVRRPDLAFHLQPLGRVGQIHAGAGQPAQPGIGRGRGARRRRRRSTWSASCSSAAASASTPSTPRAPRNVAAAAKAHGARLVHVSAIGADENSTAAYARSKAAAERLVREIAARDDGDAAVDHVRPRGQLLQPVRVAGADVAGAAAGRRRPHEIPAGVRRRRGAGDRLRGRRPGARRHHLRARRPRGAHVPRAPRIHPQDHRAPAPAGAAAVPRRQAAGEPHAVHADAAADARPGRAVCAPTMSCRRRR